MPDSFRASGCNNIFTVEGNDCCSRVFGLGTCQEEQLLLDQAVRQQQRQGPVQQGAQQPLQCPLLQVLGLGEQQDCGCPTISGRGQVCRPVHDQDQEAEHPCQALAQDTDAQGVPQDQPSIFDADGSASLVPTIFGHGGANDLMQSASGMSSPQDPF